MYLALVVFSEAVQVFSKATAGFPSSTDMWHRKFDVSLTTNLDCSI